jgi:hypothetical protein
MLGTDVLSDLNASPATGSITMSMLEQTILDDLNRTITKAMLGTDVLTDLNASPASGSITMSMLESSVQSDLNKTVARPFAASIRNPYGILGTAVANTSTNYTVPSGKTLVITSSRGGLDVSSTQINYDVSGDVSIFPEGTVVQGNSTYGWTGMLFDQISGIEPVVNTLTNYTVPSGKTLVITSSRGGLDVSSTQINVNGSGDVSIFPEGTVVQGNSTDGWTGYLIDPTAF